MEVQNSASSKVRDWPKLSISVPPHLFEALAVAAEGKGYSVSEAGRIALEKVGLGFIESMAPRAKAA